MRDRLIKGPKQYSEEWYQMRYYDPNREDPRPKIGASEAGKACGLSAYGTPRELYHEKRREIPGFSGSLSARIGSAMEATILDLAEEELPIQFPELDTGKPLKIRRNIRAAWRSSNPVVAASCDGILSPKKLGAVDAKASFSVAAANGFGDPGTDQIPTDYILQAQQQCYVQGVDRVYFPVLKAVGNGPVLHCYRVIRNDEVIKAMIDAENELVERIINADPPEPNWEHPRTADFIRGMAEVVEGKEIEMPEDGVQLFKSLERAKKALSKINKIKSELEARILVEMDGATVAHIDELGIEMVHKAYGETLWKESEIPKAGQVKRKAYTRLTSRKLKR